MMEIILVEIDLKLVFLEPLGVAGSRSLHLEPYRLFYEKHDRVLAVNIGTVCFKPDGGLGSDPRICRSLPPLFGRYVRWRNTKGGEDVLVHRLCGDRRQAKL